MNIQKTGAATILAAAAIILLLTYFPMMFPKEASIQTSAIVSSKKCVIIDAGHGGFDGGAVASDGTLEKDINLMIALDTARVLEALGYDVVLTRIDDNGLEEDSSAPIRQKKISDMRRRLEMINSGENDMFVSIHLNKYTSASPWGTQVFYSPNNEGSNALAECIQSEVINKLQPSNHRTIKKAGKDTMLLYKAEIPAVIVECGFLSNPDELSLLKNDEYRKKIALCIAAGITDFTESENNGS